MKAVRAAICAAISFYSAAVIAAPNKQAEAIGSMYADALVNTNVDQAKKLNDTLRSAFSGQDVLDISALQKIKEGSVKQFSGYLFDWVSVPHEPELKKAIVEFSETVVDKIQTTKCTVKGSEVRDNDAWNDGSKIAAIHFECMIPDVNNKIATLQKSFSSKKKQATPLYFQKLTSIYKESAATLPLSVSMDLYSNSNPKIWHTGNPDVRESVMNALTTAFD